MQNVLGKLIAYKLCTTFVQISCSVRLRKKLWKSVGTIKQLNK